MKYFLALLIISTSFFSCGQSSNVNASVDSVDTIVAVKKRFDTIIHYYPYGSVEVEFRENDTLTSRWHFELNSDTFYYPNGKIRLVSVGPSPDFDSKNYWYYMNGQLSSVTQQGTPFGCGCAVGEELNYDSLGRLLEKAYNDNYIPDDANGCHDQMTVRSATLYYKNGRDSLTKQEEFGYEGVACPCGVWKYFDSSGALIKTQKFEKCHDGKVECDE